MLLAAPAPENVASVSMRDARETISTELGQPLMDCQADGFEDGRQFRAERATGYPLRMADADLDLRGLFGIFRRRFRLILGITAAAVAAAVLFLLLSPTFYTASVQLLIDPRGQRILETEVTPVGVGADVTLVESQLRILTSDAVLGRVVARFGLAEDKEFAGKAKRKSANGDSAQINRARAIKTLRSRISVSRAESTYVIDVRARARNPRHAKTLADAIAAAYLADQIDANRLITQQAKDALTSRLELLRADLQRAEERVHANRLANGIVGAQDNLVSEQQLTELNVRLVAARSLVAQAQARYDQAQRLDSSGADAGSASEALASTVIANLRAQLAEIKRREAELASTLGNRHPSLLEVRAQLSNVHRLISQEVRRISRSAASDLAVARGNEAALANEFERLSNRSQSTDYLLITLRELERQADAARKLYEAFVNRAKQMAEQERIETPAARVLAPAEIPVGPSYPPRGLVLLLAVVLGVGLGATGALLREHLDDTVRSAAQLRGLTGSKVFVSGPEHDKGAFAPWLKGLPIPVHQPQPRLRSDDPANTGTSAAVAVRSLGSVLQEGAGTGEPRSVMVVSTRKGEGVADFAINLALATSRNGKRVLIIDADAQHRALTQLVAPDAQTGIFDVIAEQAPLASVAVANSETGLHVLPMPEAAHASAKNITRHQLAVLLAAAQTDFDSIIVCGAPLLTEPETSNLCQSVDQVVLIARAGVSRRNEIEDALRLLRIYHCEPHSTVLTVDPGDDIT